MSRFKLVVAVRGSEVSGGGPFRFLTVRGLLPLVESAGCFDLKESGLFSHYPSFEKYIMGTRLDPVVLLVSSAPDEAVGAAVMRAVALSGEGQPQEWSLAMFAAAARSLSGGADRNALQLAVQFLSTDGIDDSLVAAEYDWDFLQRVKEDLEKKKH